MRARLLTLHRWLGLPASFVLAITGLTGAVLMVTAPSTVGKIAGHLHENMGLRLLGFGAAGERLVAVITLAGVLLQLSGIVLWWKRRSLRVEFGGSLSRTIHDLHHAAGAVAFVMMLVISSAAAAYWFLPLGTGASMVNRLHHGRTYPAPVKVVYVLGSLGFTVQGCTGLLMWARRQRLLK